MDQLARPKFKGVTFEQIRYVVDTNDKQRYTLVEEEGEWWIRANQGHSLKVKVAMDPIKEAGNTVAVHGTSFEAWEAIKQSGGLKRMNRNHIHLAPGLPSEGNVISGKVFDKHRERNAFVSNRGLVWLFRHACNKSGLHLYQSRQGIERYRNTEKKKKKNLDAESNESHSLPTDGIPFYRSSNQVILTEGVDGFLSVDYFERVQDRQGQRIL